MNGKLEALCHDLLLQMKKERLRMPPWKFRCPGVGDRWQILDDIEAEIGETSIYTIETKG